MTDLNIPKDLADLTVGDLTAEQLSALLEASTDGIRIAFAGKQIARQIARRVRPRTLTMVPKYSFGSGDDAARNLLIEGDNLQAMVTLYKYRGQVDLILTDPPYNTGHDYRYNDRWDIDPNDDGLGEFVEADDGAIHTKWLKFMWPRLQMMKAMLKPGGVLAICIDHRELFRLGQMLDELFDESNRLAIINWQKATALKNDNNHVSTSTEYVLVYAKDEDKAKTGSLERTKSQTSRYSNPDNDPRGRWREGMLAARTWVAKDDYGIQSPFTGELHYPQGKSAWRHPKRHIKDWLAEWGSAYIERDLNDDHAPALVLKNGFDPKVQRAAESRLEQGPWPFIWFGRGGGGIPRKKIYFDEVKAGKIPETFWAADDLAMPDDLRPDEFGSTSWKYQESGRSSDGAAELTAIVGEDHGFETVKPLKLLTKVIQIWCPPDGLVLDPFAGSGTTGHAVQLMNGTTETTRRFILVEQGRPEAGDPYARTLTSERLRRAFSGDWVSGPREPLGGGFTYERLSGKIDGEAVLHMERADMRDTVIFSHYGEGRRRKDNLLPVDPEEADSYRYLVASNSEDEGFFLVWDGPAKNIDLTRDVYASIVEEAKQAKLKLGRYHVYARRWVYQRKTTTFYQIPDHILASFGLDVRSEPFAEEDLG